MILDWETNLITTKIDADGNLMSGHPEDVVTFDTVDHIKAYLGGYSIYGTAPPQMVQVEFLNDTAMTGAVFSRQSRLKKVIIHEGVTSVPNNMFSSCFDLVSVHIPSTVETIGSMSFGYCAAEIVINKPENSISGAPWGAENATVIWTG